MTKKILVVLAILIAAGGAFWAYLDHRNRTLSPPAEQRIKTENGLLVDIDYSRPSMRDRLIFGEEDEGALQPYGNYWRLGANEATTFEFSKAVIINGKKISAGTYGAYAIPGADSFEIGINATWDRWGFSEPDYAQDIVRFKVPIDHLNKPIEQFTIRLGETDNGVKIICEWADVRFVIPVEEA
ncbi:MAG: DUF2911 domain-containing protein [Salibacteraceae bacterium]